MHPGFIMKTRKAIIDYGLYLVTDRFLAAERSIEEVVRGSIAGGVTIVQLREKIAGTREFLNQAFALRKVTKESGIPLIINDRVDIALACGADGVHLGQEDMACTLARPLVGNQMIIGVTVNTPDEAVEAQAAGADYLGAGPVFATSTKTDSSVPIGLAGLREICQVVSIPVVGIGGINAVNAREVIRCGAEGIAVVSAIVASQNPLSAALELRSLIIKEKDRLQ